MVAAIALPRLMRIGGGASAELAAVLQQQGLSRPLIVTDRYLVDSGRVDRLADELKAAGIATRVFADSIPDPTVASVEAGLAFLREAEHDCVIGFGGGSPMDSAKAIAVLAVHGGRMQDYKAPHVQDEPGLPIIAIPTTAGTGSEATRFTIVTDEVTDEKMLCPGVAYLPIAALIDFEFTLTKPRRLTRRHRHRFADACDRGLCFEARQSVLRCDGAECDARHRAQPSPASIAIRRTARGARR